MIRIPHFSSKARLTCVLGAWSLLGGSGLAEEESHGIVGPNGEFQEQRTPVPGTYTPQDPFDGAFVGPNNELSDPELAPKPPEPLLPESDEGPTREGADPGEVAEGQLPSQPIDPEVEDTLEGEATKPPIQLDDIAVRLMTEAVTEEDQPSHGIQVSYYRDGGVDFETFQRLTVRVGRHHSALNYGGSAPCQPELEELGYGATPDELIATYRVKRPSDGWFQFGEEAVVEVIYQKPTPDGAEPIKRTIGAILFDFSLDLAHLEKDFLDWTDGLEEALALEENEQPDPTADSDGDGIEDITEYFLGSDPFSGAEKHPVDLRLVALQGAWYVTLTVTRRVDAIGMAAAIEGSRNGRQWEMADDHFEVLEAAETAPNFQKITLRSVAPIDEMGLKLFRIKTTLLD